MPIIPDGGLNESEDPTLVLPNELQVADGLEYHVGQQGIFSVKGRKSVGSVSATGRALYYAGFDGGQDFLFAQAGDTVYQGQILPGGVAMSQVSSMGANTSRLVGTHYNDRHYLVNGNSNWVAEFSSGVTTRSMGMAATAGAIGLSVTQGTSSFSVATGLQYWLTEYDNIRGIESVAGATVVSTTFTSKDSIYLSITGTSKNRNSTHWRIYRSVDGGVFPTGELLASIAIGSTFYSDTSTNVSSLGSPVYGTMQIGDLDFDRDVAPGPLSFVDSFQGSLVGFLSAEPRSLAYSAAGYPESWPAGYRIPLVTSRHDFGVAGAKLNGLYGVFTNDTVHRVVRLPREVDAAFAGGEASELVTDERGCVSVRGVAMFTIPGRPSMLAFVARDGIFVTDLYTVLPVTDNVLWTDRVNSSYLSLSSLVNDPLNRRLIFTYTSNEGGTTNDSLMYLDYQREGIRVTNPNHGALADLAIAPYSGLLTPYSLDSRASNGGVYVEGAKNTDDSTYQNSDGSINFRLRTAENLQAGPPNLLRIGRAIYMHGAGPSTVWHTSWVDRENFGTVTPHDWSKRGATDIGITRTANSISTELSGSALIPFSLHWFDIQGLERVPLGTQEGA